MTQAHIEVAPDSPPVVLGVAARLRRSAADPALGRRLARMKGVLALRSDADPQSVTIRFDRGRVSLEPGVARGAGIVITIDFNDDAVKPKIAGAARHPLFGLAASKVMEPPLGTWQEEAAGFWAFARDEPRMPKSMLVVNIDDGTQEQFGESGTPDYEVHGTGDALRAAFSGSSILLAEALTGRIMVVGTIEHSSVLTGRAIAWAMGEGR
jgi:hypothetical protein